MKASLAVLSALFCALASRADIAIAERGTAAEYEVVIPRDPSATVLTAASELTNAVFALTGVALQVTERGETLPPKAIILKADSKPQKRLGRDGFRISAREPHLLIEGSASGGILYGVFEFLERFGGVRWYASDATAMKPRAGIYVPAGFVFESRPAFEMRECCYADARDPVFASHLRLNGPYHGLPDGRGDSSRFRYVKGLGRCHTLPSLVPSGEFFASHPEYFALVDGKRVGRRQLCLTNPEVRRLVVERTLQRARRDPSAAYVGVSAADTRGWCECPACNEAYWRTGGFAGPLMELVNEVAEAVEREFPSIKVETLAYRHTRKPPRVKLRKNVQVCFCTFLCDFHEPFEESRSKWSRSLVEDLKGWRTLADDILIWDYPMSYFHHLAPYPNVNAFAGNMKFFRRMGARQILELGGDRGSEFAALKCWLLAKLMWNPDADVSALLDGFFEGYYGAAAPAVKGYFEALHSLPRDTEMSPLTFYEDPDEGNLTDGFLEGWIAALEGAEALVGGDPALLRRLRLVRLSPVYALLLRRVYQGGGVPRAGGLSNGALLEFFEQTLKEYGPVSIADWPEVSRVNLKAIRSLAPKRKRPRGKVRFRPRVRGSGRRLRR